MDSERQDGAELPPDLYDDLVKEFGAVKSVTRQVLGLLLDSGAERLGVQDSAILVPRSNDALGFLVSTNRDLMQGGLPPIPINGSIAGLVLVSAQTMSFDQAGASPEFFDEIDKAVGYSTREYLAAPIVSGDEALGVLTFVNRRNGSGSFTKADMALADKYAAAAGIVMEHIENSRRQVDETLDSLKTCVDAAARAATPEAPAGDRPHRSLKSEIVDSLERLDAHELELILDLIDRIHSDDSELVIQGPGGRERR